MDRNRTRVLSVDDHALLREAIACIITHRWAIVLVSQAFWRKGLDSAISGAPPDVTLMDLSMPDLNGIDALIAIRAEFPETRIIIHTTFETDQEVRRAVAAGAYGYLLNSLPPNQLVQVIRDEHAGERAIRTGARSLASSSYAFCTEFSRHAASRREKDQLEPDQHDKGDYEWLLSTYCNRGIRMRQNNCHDCCSDWPAQPLNDVTGRSRKSKLVFGN